MAAPDFPASPTVGQIYTAPSGILARFRPNRITRENTYIFPNRRRRSCRTCYRAWQVEYRRKGLC